jgi:hypothetical protein
VGDDYLAILFAHISTSRSTSIFTMSHKDYSYNMKVTILMDPVDGL